MHIAICSDSAAERKQIERLTEREADKWIAIGKPVYFFTYGSINSLLASSLEYDGIIIDICETENLDTAKAIGLLREKDFTAPVVDCSLDIPKESSEDIYYIKKYFNPTELHEVLLKLDELSSKRVAKIELRGEDGTFYVTEDEILYAEKDGVNTLVTLIDKKIHIHEDTFTLEDELLYKHPVFVMTSDYSVINIKHVSETGIFKFVMDDGKSFKISGNAKKYGKHIFDLLQEGSPEALEEIQKYVR